MVLKSYLFNRKFILLLSFIILFVAPGITSAQSSTGKIQGIVTDSTTSDALFGANVFISGTSLGAATDLDGKYTIPLVPPGNYTLIISYIGYIQKELSITVIENRTLQLDIILVSQVLEGEEVIITAQAQGQKSAINRQLTSERIINVVSAEKIHQLPDDDAATALSRLPGVSLMDGDKVVIRGVQAKLNQVLVNGIQMPSTDMDDRSTNLGFVSSNMLSGIEVIKAITPDMDANTIGGVVNLKLREAESGFHADALLQGNYNSSDATAGNYKTWASVSNRFFDDKLGVFFQANADRSDGGNQYANIGLGFDNSGGDVYGESVYKTDNSIMEYDRDIVDNNGLSLILDYQLPNGKIVFQNTYAANFTDQRHYQTYMDFTDDEARFTIDRNKYGKDMWINALQAENSFGDLKVEAGLSHSFTNQYTRLAYENNTWTDFHDNTDNPSPFGRNADGSIVSYKSNAAQRQITMEKAYSIYDNIDPSAIENATLEGWPSSISNTFNQHLYNASLDLSLPFNFSKDITSTFKTGGKYVRTTRMNDFNRTFTGASDDDTYNTVADFFPDRPRSASNRLKFTDVLENFDRGENFLSDEYGFKNGFMNVINTDIYDDWLALAQTGWTPSIKMDDSWKDDFNGSESFTAGYFMGTFNILQNLTLIGGFRYEKYNMKYDANFTVTIHNVYGNANSTAVGNYQDLPHDINHVDRTDENFFPNAQLRFKPNDWSDIRFAYTSGIARPDYLAIMPKIWIFPSGHEWQIGNPKLRPTTAQNLDLIFSFYSNKLGLFTVNGFYKELTDVQYETTIYYGNISMYSENDIFIPDTAFYNQYLPGTDLPLFNDEITLNYNNPSIGYVRGVEVDWQTNFWYLPEPFNSLVLDVNYTKSSSSMNYRILRNIPEKIYNPVTHRYEFFYTTIDTVYTGRLVHQGNDVVNVALGIDYKGFSGRLSFNMQGDVLNSIGTRPEETSYTGNIYRWDFTIKQELPIEGLSIALSGVNIFHNPIKSYRKYRMEPDAPVTENLVSVLYSPSIYQLNLRYNF